MVTQGSGRVPKQGQTWKKFRPCWRRCSSAHQTAEKFISLARLELVWSCWASSWPPSECRQQSRLERSVAWVCSGNSCASVSRRTSKHVGQAGALVFMSRGLQKGYFQAKSLDQRGTVFWARSCADSTKCPHAHSPRFQPMLCPSSYLY